MVSIPYIDPAVGARGAGSRLGLRALGGRWTRMRPALELAGVTLAGAVVTAILLGLNLVAHNAGGWSPGQVAELGLALGWIALVLNGLFAAAAFGLHAVLSRALPIVFGGGRPAFLLSGVVALHLGWLLLNRLPLVQRVVIPPHFVTPAGLGQTATVALACGLLLAAGLMWARRPRGAGGPALLAASALLTAGVLHWNGRDEVVYRTVPMERVHAAALAAAPPPATVSPTAGAAGAGPVIVLGFDGWGWDAIVPLMEAGRLPNLSALVRQGAVGYLDNGDDSFSPRIWNTIFSGRSVEAHGVYDFLALRLPRTGRVVPDFVSQRPAIDSYYGMKQLLRAVPSLGLWQLVQPTSSDVAVKRLWDVAGEHGRRVVVANALNTLPAQPVNGAMVSLTGAAAPSAFHPAGLAASWASSLRPGERELSDWRRALPQESAFTLSLFREHEADLGVFYSNAVDVLAHDHWDFHAENGIAGRLPSGFSDAEWDAWVVENADAPAFGAYALLDAEIGRFRAAHPDATFVVASDHGWTFSGYAHYGSQDGILVVSGPRARAGATIPDAHIRDVAPTVLALLDVPLSRELPGRVLAGALRPAPSLRHVAGYGPPQHRAVGTSEPVGGDVLAGLAALGYVR